MAHSPVFHLNKRGTVADVAASGRVVLSGPVRCLLADHVLTNILGGSHLMGHVTQTAVGPSASRFDVTLESTSVHEMGIARAMRARQLMSPTAGVRRGRGADGHSAFPHGRHHRGTQDPFK